MLYSSGVLYFPLLLFYGVGSGTEEGEWSLICTGHNLLKLFRFGVNL